ncbi:MAG: DUF1573 domain-containing protein [Streptosporangiaceae bacterium]
MALLVPVAGVASASQTPVLSWAPTTLPGTFDYGTVNEGQMVSQAFTLTNSGGSASAALTITVTGSAAFTETADSCTSLGPNKSCSVTVAYAPTTYGEIDQATLTATGKKASATASLTLQGQSAKASPTISTSPSGAGAAGITVTDTAALSGGSNPSGTITFNLYGPSATADCSTTAVDTEQVTVGGDGSYTTPNGYTTSQAGTYWWTASYSGDTANNTVSSGCGAESVTITPASHLYWTNFDTGTITEANLDGSDPQTIVTGQAEPEGVAVDSSHIYWTDNDAGTVVEANLDGSNPQTVSVASGQNSLGGVAVGP